MENILKIFNSEDKVEMKQAFKEIIKEQFKSQLENMELYLFNPDHVEELIDEAFQDIVDEVKVQFKKDVKEKLMDRIDFDKIAKKLNK